MEDDMMTTKEVADYLGHNGTTGVQQAIARGRLRVAGKESGRNLFLKSDIDDYKQETSDFTSASSFASKAGTQWTFDGGKTAIRLMKYCKEKQLSNAWEGIKELLDSVGK